MDTKEVDLDSKIHRMTKHAWSGYCDSHGCTGHRYTRLVCSCGYTANNDEYFGAGDNLVAQHLERVKKHQLDKLLGISSTVEVVDGKPK